MWTSPWISENWNCCQAGLCWAKREEHFLAIMFSFSSKIYWNMLLKTSSYTYSSPELYMCVSLCVVACTRTSTRHQAVLWRIRESPPSDKDLVAWCMTQTHHILGGTEKMVSRGNGDEKARWKIEDGEREDVPRCVNWDTEVKRRREGEREKGRGGRGGRVRVWGGIIKYFLCV